MTTSIRSFLSLCVGAGLLASTCASPVTATTLDPHHPVWSRSAAVQEAWRVALLDARDEVPPLRAPADVGALGRAAAVGRRVLVIPVLPSDATVAPVDRLELEERWFGAGENSVRGYWEWVSGGRLRLEGRVLPWTRIGGTVAQDYFNVLQGAPVVNLAAGPRNLARDALASAASVVEDLSVFDDDGPDGIAGSGDDDGVIDLVVILHPLVGWEVDPVSTGRAIVSLQARLCTIASGTCGETIAGSSLRADAFFVGSATAPLGVWVHEFGHLLGLDDLYDFALPVAPGTPGTGARLGGLGIWSLMASGTWGDAGARPSALDAWSRRRLGWGEPTLVEGSFSADLGAVRATSAPYLELRPFGDWGSERFLLENRRRRENAIVDGALPGSGVIVLRVDERAGPVDGGTRWIEVLQADGRDDLATPGGNDGDAGDPFTGAGGASRLDGSTSPATSGRDPSPDRVPPVIEIDPARSNGAHPIRVRPGSDALLALTRALFRNESTGDRTHLLWRESAEWDLGFADVGETPATSATVRAALAAGSRSAMLSTTDAVSMTRSGGVWTASTPIEVSDLGSVGERTPIVVDVFVAVDGGPERRIAMGIPVGLAPGLDASVALFDFVPGVLAAATDTTRFEPLGLVDLPRTANAGWGLRTQGERRYADDVDVVLEGPWMAVPSERIVRFWSRQLTEESSPGQVFDGGVLEIWIPDRGWRELIPEGDAVVQVRRDSGAAVRDRVALGGNATLWQTYEAELPRVDVPTRLRLRFASDGAQAAGLEGWWEVASLGTERALPTASIEVFAAPSGVLRARAELRGDLSGLDQLRYRYRVPGAENWIAASGLFGTPSEGGIVSTIEVPETLLLFEVGLFSETSTGGSGSTPPMLLGSAGHRRAVGVAPPRLMNNPVLDRMVLQVPVRDVDLPLRVFDLRGREVARLVIPAGTDWFEWDVRMPSGTFLASGRYFVALEGDPTAVFSFVRLR